MVSWQLIVVSTFRGVHIPVATSEDQPTDCAVAEEGSAEWAAHLGRIVMFIFCLFLSVEGLISARREAAKTAGRPKGGGGNGGGPHQLSGARIAGLGSHRNFVGAMVAEAEAEE